MHVYFFFSQNVQHYAAGSDLDEFVFDFSSMPTDADSCFELNADLETHKLTSDITFNGKILSLLKFDTF